MRDARADVPAPHGSRRRRGRAAGGGQGRRWRTRRRLVFNHLDISAAARRTLDPGVTWWGWHVPAGLEAAVVFALGLLLLGIAILEFNGGE